MTTNTSEIWLKVLMTMDLTMGSQMTSKAQERKEKIDQLDLVKITNIHASEKRKIK